jgi:hypothetical protein
MAFRNDRAMIDGRELGRTPHRLQYIITDPTPLSMSAAAPVAVSIPSGVAATEERMVRVAGGDDVGDQV